MMAISNGAGGRGDEPDRPCHSLEHTRTQLKGAMHEQDFDERWANAAKTFCRKNRRIETSDLVQETLVAVWSGRRNWPTDVGWPHFVYMTMRSTFHNLSSQSQRYLGEENFDDMDIEEITWAHAATSREIEENSLLSAIHSWLELNFSHDAVLLDFATMRFGGMTKMQIKEKLKINDTEYNTKYNTCKDKLRAEYNRRYGRL